MSDNWKSYTIQDFIEKGEADLKTGPFGTQLHASDYVEQGTPVINVRNIGFGNVRSEKFDFVDAETVARLSGHLLTAGDIVFGRKGAVERHAFIQHEQEGWFQGSDCLRLRLNSPSVSPRFVSYLFLTPDHQQWMINQSSHGATMSSLNQDIVSRIPLRLPPLPVQRKIAGVLSAYDDLIENNARRIALLEALAQLLYREWFVRFRFPGHEAVERVASELGPIPAGWEVKRLGDLAEQIRRNVHPDEVPPQTPYIGLGHMPKDGVIALSDWGAAEETQSSKLAFREGEILFGKIRPYFHKVGVAPVNGVSSTDAIIIVPKDDRFFGIVLGTVSSKEFVEHATQTSTGTKMPRANWDVLVEYPIPVPPEHLLRQFNHLLEDAVSLVQNLLFQNRTLRTTRDLLLPRLVSGEVDVSEVAL
jgi:type I restriction enzyme S subunit